jgi:hypothetical protein
VTTERAIGVTDRTIDLTDQAIGLMIGGVPEAQAR